MIDRAEFGNVQRRVAVLGRFNADPYDPNEWWQAKVGKRSLLYRFRIGAPGAPDSNVYPLQSGQKSDDRAARRRTLYEALRPTFREQTVKARLSEGKLEMEFTRAEIPA